MSNMRGSGWQRTFLAPTKWSKHLVLAKLALPRNRSVQSETLLLDFFKYVHDNRGTSSVRQKKSYVGMPKADNTFLRARLYREKGCLFWSCSFQTLRWRMFGMNIWTRWGWEPRTMVWRVEPTPYFALVMPCSCRDWEGIYCLNKWAWFVWVPMHRICQGHRLAYVYWAVVDSGSEAALIRTWVHAFCVTVMPLPVRLNLCDSPKFVQDDIFICVANSGPLVLFSVIEEEESLQNWSLKYSFLSVAFLF